MSEEILKALMQLFAIISKQDAGTSLEERNYVERFLQLTLNEEGVHDYLKLFDKHAGLDKKPKPDAEEDDDEDPKKKKRKLTSVRDSVRTLGICKKINKTLTQRQKIVVLVRLFELINAEQKITEQRLAIVQTAAQVFNVSKEEYQTIELFVTQTSAQALDQPEILVATDEGLQFSNAKYLPIAGQEGLIVLLHVPSVDLYFTKYTQGESEINLNGRTINNDRIYLFANGSTIRPPKGKPIFYSDVASYYMQDGAIVPLSFNVNNLQYTFPNGGIGLHEVNIAEQQGKLVGLMGASGAGKTTLLNVMAGMYKPSQGEVLLNGINLHESPEKIEGVIGYIPQDDLLIEELTVFQNLYYNAKLCFKNMEKEELIKRVLSTLNSLGLLETKDLKVGSPLDKTISGGQRKRLNIALELIREPSVLFVDEPTSGLSSRDSENVMDLLRELALKGKLIFVVIHQPSSDIYKMFDKIIVLDTGGWQIYYGNPVEALIYFKRIDHQVNAGLGECVVCGSVNPEQIFNIVEAQVVDEYGRFTDNRKISPKGWNDLYRENFTTEKPKDIDVPPPGGLNLPGKIKQFRIFLTRDLLSKIGNKQYVYLNLFIAPVLAFILSIIIRYTASNQDTYLFRENDNIPAYIFMCIIVSLFIGLTVSAEEIYRDQKILKRERFLNLSRNSYLFSKIAILFGLSLFQSGVFTLIGNSILAIDDLFFSYWMMLFAVSCFANVLGLNISSSFNSPVTIYILIPIILIPQMILGGAMFDFDKLNRALGREGKVPVLAEVMVSRWAYEGLVVNQFVHNDFTKHFYELEAKENFFDYKNAYYIPELQNQLRFVVNNYQSEDPNTRDEVAASLRLIQNEIRKELKLQERAGNGIEYTLVDQLTPDQIDEEILEETEIFLSLTAGFYTTKFIKVAGQIDEKEDNLQNSDERKEIFKRSRNNHANEYLESLVQKKYADNKLIIVNDEIDRVMGPVYTMPTASGALDFRAHFYAPKKHLFGSLYDTYYFNMGVIWFMTILLYITLYFDILKKTLYLFNRIRLKK